jgi:hypothetical protein
MYLFFLYGTVRNGFEAGKIHYEGHWKGWALEIKTFWALKWLRAKREPFSPKKVE